MSILNLEALEIEIGGQVVCRNLELDLAPGQVVGVLGRNGIGKSTLLYTLMGFRKPVSGRISLLGNDLSHYSAKETARLIGILFQENSTELPASVLETALLGRHPHNENILWDNADDIFLVREILNKVGLSELEQRQVGTLSGGEKQRLTIAMLIAQKPKLSLLDEPSNHLDIDYQIKSLALLKENTIKEQSAIIMASHDINLISRFCDKSLLLMENGEFQYGDTNEILTEEALSAAFKCPIQSIQTGERKIFFPG